MSKFADYRFLFPPRPDKAVPCQALQFYERNGYAAQYKKNGTCTVLYVTPEKEIIVRTRHDEPHKAWQPTEQSTGVFKTLPGKGWYAFVVEVLHNKTSKVKDTVYIFDILVNDSELLIGSTFQERQELLLTMFPTNVESMHSSHYVITENVWLAKLITEDFTKVMETIQLQAEKIKGNPENEGLVLKRLDAKLLNLGRKTSNSGWQVKCRVSTKNYSF